MLLHLRAKKLWNFWPVKEQDRKTLIASSESQETDTKRNCRSVSKDQDEKIHITLPQSHEAVLSLMPQELSANENETRMKKLIISPHH